MARTAQTCDDGRERADMPEIHTMIGKQVEVFANGVQYKGVLIEVSPNEVHLAGQMQWIALPASSVSQIKLVEKK